MNSEASLLVGKRSTGLGDIVVLPGRFKQFMATLNESEVEDTAVVEVYASPDATTTRGIKIAEFNLSGAEPGDICPVIEHLGSYFYGKIVSVSGGEVWLTGVGANG